MKTYAAVITGQGAGAISTIQICGNSALSVIKKIFKPAGKLKNDLKPSRFYLGKIYDGKNLIDQVTIGYENTDSLAINCHGNPLIVADIMKLLTRLNVKPLAYEDFLNKFLAIQNELNTIELEAKIALIKALTVEGTKIIANQITKGLSKTAQYWLKNLDSLNLDEIKNECRKILDRTKTAKLIIAGCKAVIAGPQNAGKSTLLNQLAGKQKSIVTHIEGTTRDWVSALCQIKPLAIEFIDTAGFAKSLEPQKNKLDKISQQKSWNLLSRAHLILLVLDYNKPETQIDKQLLNKIKTKTILTVLNKSDLPKTLQKNKLPPLLKNTVTISAKNGTGLEKLKQKILQATATVDFDLHTAVCFTNRQEKLLRNLMNAKSKEQAKPIITNLLNGNINSYSQQNEDQ